MPLFIVFSYLGVAGKKDKTDLSFQFNYPRQAGLIRLRVLLMEFREVLKMLVDNQEIV